MTNKISWYLYRHFVAPVIITVPSPKSMIPHLEFCFMLPLSLRVIALIHWLILFPHLSQGILFPRVTRGRKGWLRVMMKIGKNKLTLGARGHWTEAVGQSVQWSEMERWTAHGPMDKEMESLFFAQVFPFFAWRVVVRCRWFYLSDDRRDS